MTRSFLVYKISSIQSPTTIHYNSQSLNLQTVSDIQDPFYKAIKMPYNNPVTYIPNDEIWHYKPA